MRSGLRFCANKSLAASVRFFPEDWELVALPYMDYKFISGTVSRLRAELDHIGTESRLYVARKNHRAAEMVKHQKRKDRVMEIKLELETLMKRKVA